MSIVNLFRNARAHIIAFLFFFTFGTGDQELFNNKKRWPRLLKKKRIKIHPVSVIVVVAPI
jgi:hypothetical protein